MPTAPTPESAHGNTSAHVDQAPMVARRPEAYYAWLILFFAATIATVVLLGMQRYWLAVIVFFLHAPWYAWQILRPSARGLGPVITHFKTDQREVWLTIDDGPDPASTPAMLDLLDAYQARASFFLVGRNVQRHPELVSEILRRGHTVGNHTHTHPQRTFWCASPKQNGREIDSCAEALQSAGAGIPRIFRPPVGLKNYFLHQELARRGLDLVLWSARGFDTLGHASEKTLERIFNGVQPGAIILVHEFPARPELQHELMTGLLSRLARDGYRCVIPPTDTLVR